MRGGNGVAAARGAQAMSAQGPRRLLSTRISAGGFSCLFFSFVISHGPAEGALRSPKGAGVYINLETNFLCFITVGGGFPLLRVRYGRVFPWSLDISLRFSYRHSYIG